jgi:hypothetical protein
MNSQFIFAAALFFVINAQQTETVQLSLMWLFIRIFMGICLGTLWGYVAYLIFSYYYPGRLSTRLQRLRYTPRINPKTGNKMKLLSEEEEDAYLDEGMQAEENVFSIDYDVWIEEATGDTQIEKYKGHLTAHECDRCGFQTLRLVKEEVTEEATEFWDGEIQQEFKCSYCNRIKRKTVKLSKKVNEDPSLGKLISNPLAGHREVEVVKVEIHSNKGDVQNYEFQNLEQAKNFIEEFDYEKID